MPIAAVLRTLFGPKQCPEATGLVIGHEHPARWWHKPAPVVLTPQALRSHVLVTGAAGSGAYGLVTSLLVQQTQAGRGWVILDTYGDLEVRDTLFSIACAEGRSDQFYSLDFAGKQSDACDLGLGDNVSFADILRKDQMCYVACPQLGNSETAPRIAQCIAEDLFAAIEQHTSNSQFIVAIREPLLLNPELYGRYASIARGSRVTLLSQLQDAAMLEHVAGSEFVTANAATRIVFRHPGRAGAAASIALLGEAAKVVKPDEVCGLSPAEFLTHTADSLTRGVAGLAPALADGQVRRYTSKEAA